MSLSTAIPYCDYVTRKSVSLLLGQPVQVNESTLTLLDCRRRQTGLCDGVCVESESACENRSKTWMC